MGRYCASYRKGRSVPPVFFPLVLTLTLPNPLLQFDAAWVWNGFQEGDSCLLNLETWDAGDWVQIDQATIDSIAGSMGIGPANPFEGRWRLHAFRLGVDLGFSEEFVI